MVWSCGEAGGLDVARSRGETGDLIVARGVAGGSVRTLLLWEKCDSGDHSRLVVL